MNKQEAIDKVEGALMYKTTSNLGICVNRQDVIDIINQIDEPEKPVIPQFVADWIEENKSRFSNLYNAYGWLGFKKNDVTLWVNENLDEFAHAWLNGYEVEKEKLYTAESKLTSDFLLWDAEWGEYQFCDCVYGNFTNELTEERLKNLNIWDNPAFEIEKVE